MAGQMTGSSTVIKLVRKICRLVAIYGVGDLQTRATPEFKTAVLALVAVCSAFEALDDFPGQVDATPPLRVGEDVDFG
jgi:hypothetical protein